MKNKVIGVVAHVDAGKTTCIEDMLYESGTISALGRVDHASSVLDYDAQERDHGITIYAKDAHFIWKDYSMFVVDTPGHVDFSSEMERSLQVLDVAVLLINGQDGVQTHTETIWRCLEHYHVPAVIFVNKMDISHLSSDAIMKDLMDRCSKNCIVWNEENLEDIAMVSEDSLEEYLSSGALSKETLQSLFETRQFFPVVFGSALKQQGVDTLLDLITIVSMDKQYPEEFGAMVYDVAEDDAGNRLTKMKITGGAVYAKQKLNEEDKVDQIRIYTGKKYEVVPQASAGMIVTVKGPVHLEALQGLGVQSDGEPAVLHGYMEYELLVQGKSDMLALVDTCNRLSQEDPQLMMDIDTEKHKIHVRIMGEMQKEVLAKKIKDRTGIEVGFGTGGVVYQETIRHEVIGVGHFEPLRHYSEVVVKLTPLPRGKGVEILSEVPHGSLSLAWESSILKCLSYTHRGVLTCAALTDVRITLLAAKGSLKHTSAGDFRQAALRSVRQGLMQAENVLLEPYYAFTAEVPSDALSKTLFDLEQKEAEFEISEQDDRKVILKGKGPVRTLMNYTAELITFTHGLGRIQCIPCGYEEVKNQEEVVKEKGYDPENDVRHPTGSVFCAHGAGFYVPWNEVSEYMHIDMKKESAVSSYVHQTMKVKEEELEGILDKASGSNRNQKKKDKPVKKVEDTRTHVDIVKKDSKLQVMIIDGYNCVFGWDSLAHLKDDLSAARDKLIDYIFAYQAYLRQPVILVFDGYRRKDNIGSSYKQGGVEVVYTRTDITADAYIERYVYQNKKKLDCTVVTGDALIQNAALANGAKRMSSRELEQQLHLRGIV